MRCARGFSARARPTRCAPWAASRVESSRPATNYRSVRLLQRSRGRNGRKNCALADGLSTELRVILDLCSIPPKPMPPEGVLFWIPGKVAPEADRIGYRSRAAAVSIRPREPPFGAGSIPPTSPMTAIRYGSIQVHGGTEPIVLHLDAVSAEATSWSARVISADNGSDRTAFSPIRPVRFVKVKMDQALAARKVRASCWRKSFRP